MSKILLSVVLPIVIFALVLGSATTYAMLDAFVLDRDIGEVTIDRRPVTDAPSTDGGGNSPSSPSDGTATTESSDDPEVEYPIVGDLYYKDENIEISIEECEVYNYYGIPNKVFIVDLKLSSVEYLKTFVNTNSSGKVSTATVSDMAEKTNAVFAINGDYFSYRERGFVVRNYTYWRTSARKKTDRFGDDALLLLSDGTFKMVDENSILYNGKASAEGLPLNTYQCFSFGPRLIENGVIQVDERSEVGQSAEANPRTAIGVVSPLHYKIVVAEGRLDRWGGRDGFKLWELAELMQSLGCTDAYNLDGGSSTTLYFNGKVLNELPSNERKVSDCIYINGLTFSEEEKQ